MIEETRDRLIVALDVPTMDKMKELVTTLGESVHFYKVGMELYYRAGSDTIAWLREQGKRVFLDVKMYDIPNTVKAGMRSLSRHGADLITIHAGGGRKMMEAAVAAAEEAEKESGTRPKVLAVTVLTSFDEGLWEEAGGKCPVKDAVLSLAKLAKDCGVDGVVASAEEAALIRQEVGNDFYIVTPGIRPTWAAANDQKRIVTPKDALRYGASHLVVGRPITQAANPKEAAEKILEEIKENA